MKKKSSIPRRTPTKTGHHHSHPPADMVTAGDLLAGAVMPMRVRLNVTIRPGSRVETEQPSRASTRFGARRLTLDARLHEHTPKLLEWGKRNSKNAALLLSDASSAAERAGLRLSPGDRRALKRHTEALSPSDVLPAGVELVGLKIAIASEPYAKRREASAPTSTAEARKLAKRTQHRKTTKRGRKS